MSTTANVKEIEKIPYLENSNSYNKLINDCVSLGSLSPTEREFALRECVEIDQERLVEHGLVFSEEAWSLANFKSERVGKKELTHLMFDAQKRVVGYWVASLRNGNIHHTHRVATRKNCGILNVAKSLGRETLKVAESMGCSLSELTVNIRNERAVSLYRDLGFSILRGDALKRWICDMGFGQYSNNEDIIFISESYQLRVLVRQSLYAVTNNQHPHRRTRHIERRKISKEF